MLLTLTSTLTLTNTPNDDAPNILILAMRQGIIDYSLLLGVDEETKVPPGLGGMRRGRNPRARACGDEGTASLGDEETKDPQS